MKPGFDKDGFAIYCRDPAVLDWSRAALPLALAAVQDPVLRARWLVCQGTWFVGVDALPSDAASAVAGVPLTGSVVEDLKRRYPQTAPLHPAQVSGVFPGYPKPREGETDAAFRYRLRRDAAHVDGLHAKGPQKRRHLAEPHAYILGLPLTDCNDKASPTVAWRGSHRIMGAALAGALAKHPSQDWATVDLTEVYQAARRKVFETCERVPLAAKPGEALVMHRHLLHGVSPWSDGAIAPPEGRIIAFFRPELTQGFTAWMPQG